jgi:hypothetical protein
MIGGTESTVLHPLRTLAGISGGSANDDNTGGTTTTTSASSEAATKSRRTTTTDANDATTTTKRATTPTTTVRPSVAPTTPPAGNTGGTPPTSPIGNCKANDLDYTTRTNKPAYRPNEQVGVELVVRNKSNVPCYAPNACGVSPWVSIEDTAGAVIWKNSPKTVTCGKPAPTPPLLNPNDAHNYGTVASWNQLVCPDGDGCAGPHAVAGTYSAQAHRGDTNAGGVVFALRG